MNCQFEFTVTQCSVAYGEEEEKQSKTKQNKKQKNKKNYRFVMPYNLISCFLIIYWGSCSKIGL